MTDATTFVLGTADVLALNAARDVLKALARECPLTWSGGHAHAHFEASEEAIFEALLVARVYLGADLTDAQVDNR